MCLCLLMSYFLFLYAFPTSSSSSGVCNLQATDPVCPATCFCDDLQVKIGFYRGLDQDGEGVGHGAHLLPQIHQKYTITESSVLLEKPERQMTKDTTGLHIPPESLDPKKKTKDAQWRFIPDWPAGNDELIWWNLGLSIYEGKFFLLTWILNYLTFTEDPLCNLFKYKVTF